MVKCVYCNNEIETPYPITVGKDNEVMTCCSDNCADRTLAFFRLFERTKPLFYIGIVFSVALILVSAILLSVANYFLGSILMGSGFALLGLTILLFPFATPQTFNKFGIRKTLWIVRIIGIGIIVVISPLITIFLMM